MSVLAAPPRIAVIIASTGRPDCLAVMAQRLQRQSMPPARIVFSVVSAADAGPQAPGDGGIEVITGPKGLPTQRNTALRHLAGDCDIIAFFDDDYIPSRFNLERMGAFFAANPGVAAANGLLLADGINSAGIAAADAINLVDRYDAAAPHNLAPGIELEGLYGCNMAYRSTAAAGILFDERLKLYGWQEDIDFATQVAKRGRVVKCEAFAGVHQGVKGARTSGLRLGYSQVVNPLYLIAKGTMSRSFGWRLMLRNIAANHWRALRPEPWVDRIGRVKGNWLGLGDAVRGRLTPERIETL